MSNRILNRAAGAVGCLILAGKCFGAAPLELTRADYVDRVPAVWAAQMCGVMLAWPHEHQVSSALWLTNFPKRYTTTPVDERISELAARTAVIGESIIAANGGTISGNTITIPPQASVTQPAEIFKLADLLQYWNPDWKLERAAASGAGGGMGGIRGITHLAGDVLATYPRDEVRGCLLMRRLKRGATPKLTFEAGSDAGGAWELNVYADNTLLEKRVIEGGAGGPQWRSLSVDLQSCANRDIPARQRGLSGMPEGFGQSLSQRDLRDLVEFFANLK